MKMQKKNYTKVELVLGKEVTKELVELFKKETGSFEIRLESLEDPNATISLVEITKEKRQVVGTKSPSYMVFSKIGKRIKEIIKS